MSTVQGSTDQLNVTLGVKNIACSIKPLLRLLVGLTLSVYLTKTS